MPRLHVNLAVCISRRELVVYLNAFSGDATTEFPSTLQMARGGVCPWMACTSLYFNSHPYFLYFPQIIDFNMHLKILADAMGLGKTIMTISLLLAHSERGGISDGQSMSQPSSEGSEVSKLDHQPDCLKKARRFSGFDKLMKRKNGLVAGGNLIVCPMTLLGQWKVSVLQFLFTVCSFAYL